MVLQWYWFPHKTNFPETVISRVGWYCMIVRSLMFDSKAPLQFPMYDLYRHVNLCRNLRSTQVQQFCHEACGKGKAWSTALAVLEESMALTVLGVLDQVVWGIWWYLLFGWLVMLGFPLKGLPKVEWCNDIWFCSICLKFSQANPTKFESLYVALNVLPSLHLMLGVLSKEGDVCKRKMDGWNVGYLARLYFWT